MLKAWIPCCSGFVVSGVTLPVTLKTDHWQVLGGGKAGGFSLVVTCSHIDVGVQDQKQKPDSDFEPNLVNTVCFVVNFIIQLSTFACNYQGAPFNTPIMETKGFFNMLKYSYVFCFAITYDFLGIGTAFSLVSSQLVFKLDLELYRKHCGIVLLVSSSQYCGHAAANDIPIHNTLVTLDAAGEPIVSPAGANSRTPEDWNCCSQLHRLHCVLGLGEISSLYFSCQDTTSKGLHGIQC